MSRKPFSRYNSIHLLLGRALVQPWHAFVGIFLTGTAWALDFSARRSYYSEVFSPDRLVNAVSLETAALTGSAMLGPLVGGALISLIDFTGAYAAMLVMYVLALGLISLAPRVDVPARASATDSVAGQVAQAVRAVRANRTIWAALLVTIALNFFGFPYLQMVPVIARDVLGVGSVLYGALTSAAGIGALTGSLLIATFTVRRQGSIYSLGSCLMLAGLLGFALSFVLLIMAGLGTGGFATMQTAIVLQAASPEMRGRAMGAIALGIGASPLGMLVVGQMAEMWGPQMALALLSGTGLVVMTALRWALPELRDQPREPAVKDHSKT